MLAPSFRGSPTRLAAGVSLTRACLSLPCRFDKVLPVTPGPKEPPESVEKRPSKSNFNNAQKNFTNADNVVPQGRWLLSSKVVVVGKPSASC